MNQKWMTLFVASLLSCTVFWVAHTEAICGVPPGSRYAVYGFSGGSDGEFGATCTVFFQVQTFGGAPITPVWGVDIRGGTDALPFRDRFLTAANGAGQVTFIPGENTCRCGMPTVVMHHNINDPAFRLMISPTGGAGTFVPFVAYPWPGACGRGTGSSQVIPCNNAPHADEALADDVDGPLGAGILGDTMETGTVATGVPLSPWAIALLGLAVGAVGCRFALRTA